ncbi:efflux RND transporter periplasmic adaptor subunit [Sphingobacterium yanglingense]|uniref:RND family efflux transporter MFP subunit n=1 Tax=Sphingobacterium yanglingense TaxID=1437280 RepID=A0A4R6W8N3_9SPHI|nr:efflux RND transporter periplasmic adaptor subunit [Sphingobacterium yanglingense]TDQ73742.1 RND family efflux transporter MFP subunit [Sphingobacterium yanglingense]
MKLSIKTILPVITILLLIVGCNSNKSKEERAAAKEAHSETEEESTTIATLSKEQIASVGISWGNMEYKDLMATIKVNGQLSVPNNNKANATSLYGGVIKSLLVQLGDYVRKGQTIATITNPQYIQLQEEYLTVTSQIVLAEQELERQQELNASNAGTGKNLQTARTTMNTLRTRKASLQQQIALMGIDINSLTDSNLKSVLVVKSPINGTVSNVFAKIGSYVDVSSPVIEVVDNSLIHLDLQVFEKDLPKVKIGQVIDFSLTNNPGVTYKAKVFRIGASFENESKSIAVHCDVLGDKQGLIDGMNTIGLLGVGDRKALAVPNEAIVDAEGKSYIFVVTDKEGEAHHDEAGHEHQEGEGHEHPHIDSKPAEGQVNFEKIEIAKGVSELGYTAITPVRELPKETQIVVKGAFFINAKLGNTGGHDH